MLAHFPFGVGYGNYSSAFNHQQAVYFSQHSLTDKRAMLADNGYYALNDFLHTGIEFGIIGLLLLLLFFTAVLIKSIWILKSKETMPVQFATALFFVSLFMQCLFSYPLHYLLVIVSAIIGYFILFAFPPKRFWVFSFTRYKIATRSFIALVAGLLIVQFYRYTKMQTIYNDALEDTRTGYKREALRKFQEVRSALKYEYGFVDAYASTLYLSGNTIAAINLLEANHPHACSRRFHTELGKWYSEVGDSTRAVSNLTLALYIAPQYLETRFELLKFYDSKKDSAKANYWAVQIIQCPVKINNPKAYTIKDEATLYLKRHS